MKSLDRTTHCIFTFSIFITLHGYTIYVINHGQFYLCTNTHLFPICVILLWPCGMHVEILLHAACWWLVNPLPITQRVARRVLCRCRWRRSSKRALGRGSRCSNCDGIIEEESIPPLRETAKFHVHDEYPNYARVKEAKKMAYPVRKTAEKNCDVFFNFYLIIHFQELFLEAVFNII